MSRIKIFLLEYLIINISLFVITTPILLFVFYKVSFGQLIFNFIYIPLFSIVIFPLAILSLFLSIIFNTIFLFNIDYNIFKIITDFLSGDYFLYHPIKIWQLSISMIVILLFLIILNSLNNINFKELIYNLNTKTKIVSILVLVLLYSTIFIPINRFDGINIYFLSVGNGDSILITDNDKSLLIDAGSSLKGRNGERVISPHLDYLGIDKIDYMILTHQDEDHYGGLKYLVKHNRVNKLYLNTIFDKPLKDLNINYEMIPDYKEIKFDNIKIKLFAPLLFDDKNANSIITLIEYKGYKFLFTGDATQERERFFIEKNSLIRDIDILKAGHHGSKTSSNLEFLKKINPKYTIFSSGIDNRFGHPHKEVLDRFKSLNLKYYRTDRCGEIHFNIEKEIKVRTLGCD